jgi:hypothetical protein
MTSQWSRRDLLRTAAAGALGALLGPGRLLADPRSPDESRLDAWTAILRADGLAGLEVPLGRAAARAGELAAGTIYEPGTLDAYLRAGGAPAAEPLTVSLTRFDCVTLVESCLALGRIAAEPTWSRFGKAIEQMRYRSGRRMGYVSRLHYFSEWIADGAARGLARDLGAELGGTEDARPLRFMTEHRASYPALREDEVYEAIGAIERRQDGHPRLVVPTKRIPEVVSRIETGDVLAFASESPGAPRAPRAAVRRRGAGDPRDVARVRRRDPPGHGHPGGPTATALTRCPARGTTPRPCQPAPPALHPRTAPSV